MYIVNLYNIRWIKKYSQQEIQKATGLSKNTISKLFSGKYHDFTISTLETISKFFGCKIHDILIYTEDKENS